MQNKGNTNRIFHHIGEFLVALFKLDQAGKGNSGLQQELLSLSSGKKMAVHDYYVKKMAFFAVIMTGGMLISLAGLISYLNLSEDTQIQSLARPGYGEGDRKEELEVYMEGEEGSRRMEVTIKERKYTESEKDDLLSSAVSKLDQIILGTNTSLDEVRDDLFFPQKLEGDSVRLSWITIPYGVIAENGSLINPDVDTGTLVEIRAVLSCEEKEVYYNAFANVFPPIRSENEEMLHSIAKEVEMADAKDSHETALALPEDINGKTLTWSRPNENPFGTLLVLTLVVAIAVYVEMDSQVHQKSEDRKKQLMMDYPDLMWKMTMLLGAGLSIKGTFSRIASEYLREQKRKEKQRRERTGGLFLTRKKEKKRYVYEEVCYACYEMESGVSEAQAYERFGRRCQLPEYIRIGTVLSQNLKKGSKGLTALLEEEAEASMTERKNNARKIGEKTGTKLLLPMILMLIVVLIILMVPAFLSF